MPVDELGEAAQHFGLATHILWHWESMGLITPDRAAGDQRRYRRGDLYRIAVIMRPKEAGFGLGDIRKMFDAAPKVTLKRSHQMLTLE